jgi:hypothetical protein
MIRWFHWRTRTRSTPQPTPELERVKELERDRLELERVELERSGRWLQENAARIERWKRGEWRPEDYEEEGKT